MKVNKVFLILAGIILAYLNISPVEIYPTEGNEELTLHGSRILIRMTTAIWCGVTASFLNRNYYIFAIFGLVFPVITLFVTGFINYKK